MTQPIGDRFGQLAAPAREVRVSVEIEASPDVVFRALADPRELVAWLGDMPSSDASSDDTPSDDDVPGASRDAANGGSRDANDDGTAPPLTPAAGWLAHVRAPDGTPGIVSGEYLSVIPPRSLTTTWSASWDRLARDEVRFELAPIVVAGVPGTRVTVTHRRRSALLLRGGATVASADTSAVVEDETWSAMLTRLATYVATRNALASFGIASGDLAQAFGALHRRVVAIHQGESA